MNIVQRIATATVALLVCLVWGQAPQTDVLVQALHDEMERTLSELKDEESDSGEIYFVSYRVLDTQYVSKNYELGAHVSTRQGGDRVLQVDLRIGSYDLDQSNFTGGRGVGNFTYQSVLPREDDYHEIRRVAWRLTDAAFKNRINVYAQKQTALANQSTTEDRDPDFTQEEPYEYRTEKSEKEPGFDRFVDAGKELSSLFLDISDIHSSRVSTTAVKRRIVFVNSEGSFSDYEEQRCEILTTAMTQNESGQELRDFRAHYSIDCSKPSDMEVMQKDIQRMIVSLQGMRAANELDDVYFGPIMFEGQAAAQFLKTYLISKLSATRPPLTANPSQFRRERNSFLDRIGARVVSVKIDVVNDPKLTEYQGHSLIGTYPVDLEGIPAQRTLLVEDGRLKSMLTTRTPVDDFRKSNGSLRSVGFFGSLGTPGNVLITPKEGLSEEEMREELWQLLLDFNVEYGVVVRQISSPNAITGSARGLANVMEAYKVYPDGREEMLPPVELLDITDRTLRDIVAVSEKVTLFNTSQFGRANQSGVNVLPVSVVAPSFIVEELGVRKVQSSGALPPVVPHPYAQSPALGN